MARPKNIEVSLNGEHEKEEAQDTDMIKIAFPIQRSINRDLNHMARRFGVNRDDMLQALVFHALTMNNEQTYSLIKKAHEIRMSYLEVLFHSLDNNDYEKTDEILNPPQE